MPSGMTRVFLSLWATQSTDTIAKRGSKPGAGTETDNEHPSLLLFISCTTVMLLSRQIRLDGLGENFHLPRAARNLGPFLNIRALLACAPSPVCFSKKQVKGMLPKPRNRQVKLWVKEKDMMCAREIKLRMLGVVECVLKYKSPIVHVG